MCIGNVERVKTSEFYPTGRKMKCSDCLYGNRNNCPSSLSKRCGEYLGWLRNWKYEMSYAIRKQKRCHDMTLLFEIIDNEDYYDYNKDENDDEARWYMHCNECGYIPYKRAAYDKCMENEHFVQCNYIFTIVEIQLMKEDKKYSDWMKDEYDE